MSERKPGPVFKVGSVYLRTMEEADGSRSVHPGDVRKCWPRDGSGPKATDPEVQKWFAWMRGGKAPQSRQLEIKKIPTHAAKLQLVTSQAAVSEAPGPMRYCKLFDAMAALGLSAEEGREYVESGRLQLSAEHADAPLSEMLVERNDLRTFMQKTGCSFAPTVRH